MAFYPVKQVGQYGVNKDLSRHEIPDNIWTDASNIRFFEGYAYHFLGYSEIYPTPSYAPQYILPINYNGDSALVYASASKTHMAWVNGGSATHTDLTHVTPRTGALNGWTGVVFSGIPVLNAGDLTSKPMAWDGNIANKFVDLPNWPANTYCRAIRSYKQMLFALNVTKTTTPYKYMVKWSHPADPGAVPPSWDETDPALLAGEFDISEGNDIVVDGLQLRDSFIVYKERSTFRLDYVGGQSIFKQVKLFDHGVMGLNCVVEVDGKHLVLTQNDVILHDGQNAVQILDKTTRRGFLDEISSTYRDRCFVSKNPFLHEAYIFYPAGQESTTCNKALVFNWVDGTVSFRSFSSINCAAYGPYSLTSDVSNNPWSGVSETWAAYASTWNNFANLSDRPGLILGSANLKLYTVDSAFTDDGAAITSYMERKGLSLGMPEKMKLVRGLRPRVRGESGKTIYFKVGCQSDPFEEPQWTDPVPFTIGQTVAIDLFCTGRYISVRVESGDALTWRLDSYDIDVVEAGAW